MQNNNDTYLMIKLSKTITMADLQQIADTHGCSFHQATFKQPEPPIIANPLKSRMVINVPHASGIKLTPANS